MFRLAHLRTRAPRATSIGTIASIRSLMRSRMGFFTNLCLALLIWLTTHPLTPGEALAEDELSQEARIEKLQRKYGNKVIIDGSGTILLDIKGAPISDRAEQVERQQNKSIAPAQKSRVLLKHRLLEDKTPDDDQSLSSPQPSTKPSRRAREPSFNFVISEDEEENNEERYASIDEKTEDKHASEPVETEPNEEATVLPIFSKEDPDSDLPIETNATPITSQPERVIHRRPASREKPGLLFNIIRNEEPEDPKWDAEHAEFTLTDIDRYDCCMRARRSTAWEAEAKCKAKGKIAMGYGPVALSPTPPPNETIGLCHVYPKADDNASGSTASVPTQRRGGTTLYACTVRSLAKCIDPSEAALFLDAP